MSDNVNQELTRIDDVAVPRRVVALKRLRDRSGQPVRVACEAIDELVIQRITGAVPGIPAGLRRKDRNGEGDHVEPGEAEKVMPYAEQLIEAGVRMMHADGSEGPAFWFTAPIAGALPGRFLSVSEKVLLFVTIMELCGYVGGHLDEVRFPGGDGEGMGDGLALPGTGDASGDAPAPAGDAAAPADAGPGVGG